jgi:hypothetical protein
LNSKIRQAGFDVVSWRYVDSIGVLAALTTKILGYKGKLGLGGDRSLRLYDKVLFPISKWMDRLGLKYFFGKNLFMVVEKKSDS